MLHIFKRYAANLFSDWTDENLQVMSSLLESNPKASIVDLGCGDGDLTKVFAKRIKSKFVTGVEGLAIKIKGVKLVKANLNRRLPLPSNSYDVVISHYSLEHLYNSGLFIHESYRILKKGGYMLVATDNLSSWANVISLILGWQPFSLTSGVGKNPLGNPFARVGFTDPNPLYIEYMLSGEFSHNKVMTYQMLKEAFTEYSFNIEEMYGVGYFPFFGILSRFFAKLDIRHSHFLILKARK